MRVLRSAALLLVLLLVAAGCGQKSGVAGSGGGFQVGAGAPADDLGEVDGGTGAETGSGDLGVDTGAGGDVPTGTDGNATLGGGGTGAGAGGATAGNTAGGGGAGGGGDGGGGATAASGPGNRTGISDKVIKIGFHAPVTGAAPFPQTAFEKGLEVYWKWLKDTKGGVHGREVHIEFRDDQYNPSRAVQVCRELVEKEKVFLLVGGGGADQITACAKYANQAGVPYLSAGVNEAGLANLSTYFATSMSYASQSTMLAQYAKNVLKKTKIGVAVLDTPSFADAHSAFLKVARAKDSGLEVVADERIPKSASQTDTLAVVQKMRNAGAEVVYILSSPAQYIQIATQAQGQAYDPFWIGPGLTSGLNIVAKAGCPAVSKARFLSPFPQLDAIDQLDPAFRPAYQKYAGSAPDDIGIAIWGANKGLHAVFDAAGKDMSRESFMATLRSGRTFQTNVYPPVKYGKGQNFGASQAHMLAADCSRQEYITEHRFASGF